MADHGTAATLQAAPSIPTSSGGFATPAIATFDHSDANGLSGEAIRIIPLAPGAADPDLALPDYIYTPIRMGATTMSMGSGPVAGTSTAVAMSAVVLKYTATATPSTIATASSTPVVSAAAGSSTTPSQVGMATFFPTVRIDSVVTPAAIETVTAAGSPVMSMGADIFPSLLVMTVEVPQPTLYTSSLLIMSPLVLTTETPLAYALWDGLGEPAIGDWGLILLSPHSHVVMPRSQTEIILTGLW